MKKLFKEKTIIIFAVGVLTGVALTLVTQRGDLSLGGYGGGIMDDGNKEVSRERGEADSVGTASEILVTKVIDGDTIEVSTGERVRLIGIDTPERGELFYEDAKRELEGLVDSDTIRMEKDVSEKDRYGRLLRHLYNGDVWINAEMIRRGYARMVTFPPDVAHVETFRALEQEAIDQKRGLWHNQ